MVKINFHQHSTGSDGNSSPEEVVKEAIKRGITHLCFTDHYPRPRETLDKDWDDSKFHSRKYTEEVLRLKEEYSNRISISFGVELDWIQGYEDWIKKVTKNKFDFIIGSVHVLKVDGEWRALDSSKQEWLDIAKKLGGVENLISEYYNQRRLMVKSGLFDCVGHLDYIKLLNKNSGLFSESDPIYVGEVIKTLDVIKRAGVCVEINTAGYRKSSAQYPSEWILREMHKRNIPITIGSDGHHAEHVDFMIDEAYNLAKAVGYKSVLIFENRKPREVKI